MRVWLLRLVWCTLPLAAGPAVGDALSGWASRPQVVALSLCWLAWGAGIVATLAPRPAGLTFLRTLAPAFAVLAIATTTTGSTTGLVGWGAVVATLVTAALVADDALAAACANGVAYGDERRYPLRTPPALFLGPLPLVRMLVVVGVTAGPLLLADGRIVVGLVASVAGVAAVFFGSRALHGLSRRWMVLVPAGVVIADPLTLADPTLFVREHVRSLRAADPTAPIAPSALDLRLGATWGTLVVTLDEEVDLLRSARGRHGGQTVHAGTLLVAVSRRDDLLVAAAQRRVRVEAR